MARVGKDDVGGAPVLAFLDMLAWSEIGDAMLAASDDGYNVLVGSVPGRINTFSSYADHPRLTIVVKFKNGLVVKSSAAGRYQIIKSTWDGVRKIARLGSFSPENQDRAVVELLRETGALEHIVDGASIPRAMEIVAAIKLEEPVWASLPGAGYGQPEHKLLDCLRVYGAALAKYEGVREATGL